MPLQISIPDDDTKYLNQPARAELETSIKKFSDELLKEASRLEAAGNTTGGSPEITSSMIRDATLLLRRGYRKPRKGGLLVATQIIAVVATFITGLLADLDKLKDPRLMIAFIVFLSAAITSTVLALLKELSMSQGSPLRMKMGRMG